MLMWITLPMVMMLVIRTVITMMMIIDMIETDVSLMLLINDG